MFHGDEVEGLAQHPVEAAGELHLLLEEHAVLLLCRGTWVAGVTREGAHHPFAAPLVSHRRPHPPLEPTQVSVTYNSHIYKVLSYYNNIYSTYHNVTFSYILPTKETLIKDSINGI